MTLDEYPISHRTMFLYFYVTQKLITIWILKIIKKHFYYYYLYMVKFKKYFDLF